MFKKGVYLTKSGLRAVVARVRSESCQFWVLIGAIEVDGIFYFHKWSIEGLSRANDGSLDLVRDEAA